MFLLCFSCLPLLVLTGPLYEGAQTSEETFNELNHQGKINLKFKFKNGLKVKGIQKQRR